MDMRAHGCMAGDGLCTRPARALLGVGEISRDMGKTASRGYAKARGCWSTGHGGSGVRMAVWILGGGVETQRTGFYQATEPAETDPRFAGALCPHIVIWVV